MVTLNLDSEQQQALLDILECSVSDIRSEIVHTENHCLKEILKSRKQVLVGMLESLRQQPALS
jgi:hypothetical protein